MNPARRVWNIFTLPSPAIRQPEQRIHAYLLSILILILLFLGWSIEIATIIISLPKGGYTGYRYTMIISVPLLAVFWISRTKYYRIGTWLTLVIIYLAIYYFTLYSDAKIYPPYLSFLCLCIMFSSFFFGYGITTLNLVFAILSMLALPIFYPTVSYVELILGPMTLVFGVGVFTQVISIQHNLVEKERRRGLAEREEHYSQIFSAITSIMIGVDANRKVIHWNTVAAEKLEIPTESAIGMDFFSLPLHWDWESISPGVNACITEGKQIRLADVHLLHSLSGSRILGITITPLALKEQEQTGFLLVGADITGKRLLEQQLGRSQKMEAIGQLAAGVAHEINTPTQFVGSNLRFLHEGLTPILNLVSQYETLRKAVVAGNATRAMAVDIGPAVSAAHLDYFTHEGPAAVEQSLDGISRISRIVAAMRDFSHPDSSQKEPADINHIIQGALSLSQNEWKNTAEIKLNLDPNLPKFDCLPGELSQVFINLVINAIHAIQDKAGMGSLAAESGGQISITSSLHDAAIEIRVSDNGCGIPLENRDRIFDPFFTTKELGRGTGQGLSIVYNVVVNKHAGQVDFESEPGRGTTFFICLPLEERYDTKNIAG